VLGGGEERVQNRLHVGGKALGLEQVLFCSHVIYGCKAAELLHIVE
jgi:hypothetical protein